MKQLLEKIRAIEENGDEDDDYSTWLKGDSEKASTPEQDDTTPAERAILRKRMIANMAKNSSDFWSGTGQYAGMGFADLKGDMDRFRREVKNKQNAEKPRKYSVQMSDEMLGVPKGYFRSQSYAGGPSEMQLKQQYVNQLNSQLESIKHKNKSLNEGVDPHDIEDLAKKFSSGEIDYDEFKSSLESLEYTDHSMRQGEMGHPDMRDDMAWDKERKEWDDFDSYHSDEEPDDYEEYEESNRNNSPSLNEGYVTNECGGDMPPSPQLQKQDDQVSMTVNMSGSGSGGIKDILDILRNIESGSNDHHMGDDDDDGEIMIIDDEPEMEEYANTPEEKYSTLRSIIRSGDDMHKSKQSYSDKPYHGDNPMAVKEKLESLYKFVKSR